MDKKELASDENNFLKDLLDIKQDLFMKWEDVLCYLWSDQIPNVSRPDLGIPLPLAERLQEAIMDGTPTLDDLIEQWVENSQEGNDWWEWWEGLRRLLKMLTEHNLQIPGPLQVWASRMAIDGVPKPPKGPREKVNYDARVYWAFRFLTHDKNLSRTTAWKIIADISSQIFRYRTVVNS